MKRMGKIVLWTVLGVLVFALSHAVGLAINDILHPNSCYQIEFEVPEEVIQ